uniref:zinc finger protein 385D-like isoform X2 n=1 Tax=Myxine glutinosa TaxID=7769 RepID=UPI0035900B05
MLLASACPLGGFPRLLGAQATVVQPAIDLKRILHIPIDLGFLASNLNHMDPVQKAVVTHTFGVPLMPRRRQLFTCNLCQIRFNSEHQASAHFKGNKHSKRLKSLEAGKGRRRRSGVGDRKGDGATSKTNTKPAANLRCTEKDSENREVISATRDMNAIPRSSLALTPTQPQECCLVKLTERSVDVAKDAESEDVKAQRLLYCSLCKVIVNSRSQLEAHNKGSKHKTMIQARDGGGVIKAFPRLGTRPQDPQETIKTSLQDKTFYCETCDVHVNSESQLKQHITSRRHKDRVAGKPAKPKFCPYNKLLRNPTQLTVKESQKSTFSSPFLATISNAMNLQGALHSSAIPLTAHSLPAPPLSRFFHGQPPIRNAPGVMCTPTRTPIMFTPY